ncbi:MAG TPA: HD-GYP domain-containing protein [Sporichthyaceae bacterium]
MSTGGDRVSPLSWPARLYIAAVLLVAVIAAAGALHTRPDLSTLLLITVLFAVLDPLSTVSLARGVTLSASFPVSLAAAILLGPCGAAVVGLGSLAWQPARPPWPKRLFNAAELAVAAAAAGAVYRMLGGDAVLTADDFPWVLPVVGLAALAHSAVNAGLVAGVLRLAEGVPLRRGLRSALSSGLAGYLLYGVFGLLMAVLWSSPVGAFAALLVLLPLLVARWAFGQYAAEREAYERTMRALVATVEAKDLYTRGHSERVALGVELIGRQVGLPEPRVEVLRFAGMLHDLGKVGVPTALLRKGGRLTADEYAQIAEHPARGVEMVREIAFLHEALTGIAHHHERLDGKGYPDGLAGEDIPYFARVIGVADAFDAMTTTRAYRSARGTEEAIAELRAGAGTQFDPALVDAFVAAIAEQGWQRGEVAEQPSIGPVSFDHDDPLTAAERG